MLFDRSTVNLYFRLQLHYVVNAINYNRPSLISRDRIKLVGFLVRDNGLSHLRFCLVVYSYRMPLYAKLPIRPFLWFCNQRLYVVYSVLLVISC